LKRWKLFRLRGSRTFASAVLLGLLLWMVAVPPSIAQAEDTSAEEPALETTSKPTRVSTLPPLPFNGPQVGPLFKQGFPDDVERWTTAFIPKSLDMLTPIEMPTDEERWIRVDLSEQLVIAYEGETPVRGFVVSSGLPRTPTVTGEFRIRTKVRSQTMTGGDPSIGTYYNLPNVEWVQYFYEDYSFHGTYWHRNFGQPMSHGCLNMTIRDAKWLFDWAGPEWDGKTTWYAATPDNPGTLVIITE
jgi:lipoprotein-anchoring transpeptidase ErfK/SrfK